MVDIENDDATSIITNGHVISIEAVFAARNIVVDVEHMRLIDPTFMLNESSLIYKRHLEKLIYIGSTCTVKYL